MNARKATNELTTELSKLVEKSCICARTQYVSNSAEVRGTCGMVQTK